MLKEDIKPAPIPSRPPIKHPPRTLAALKKAEKTLKKWGYDPFEQERWMSFETNLADIERHCNNYFNPANDPNSKKRNYPPEFISLANRIREYRNSEAGQPTNRTSENIANLYSWEAITVDGGLADWTHIFKSELSIYKRARFI
ncbi:MAG: hypothetical protein FWG63_03925 [Defluviitaleaceae bacterium]|nr:hypothetical protein [Defluviitaleaceae bacterium]